MLKLLAAAFLAPTATALALGPLPPADPTPSAPAAQDTPAPPGLVFLKGGRGTFGTDRKTLEKLVNEKPSLREVLRPLDAETPEVKQQVNPFFIGRTEVTNEQYLAFVKATGHRPPTEWGSKAIEEVGRKDFFERQNAAKQEGRPFDEKFDRSEWWIKNWEEQEYECPKDSYLEPVVFVNYNDVQAYCAWAGFRVPTEFEWEFACRGSKGHVFPWGDEFDPKKANTSATRGRQRLTPVGAFTEGVTKEGLLDMCGNVWEWTSSPYVAYSKKFKAGTYKIGKEKVEAGLPRWDVARQSVRGGSYQTDDVLGRATTRRGTDRTQITGGMGFRVAATPRIGEDVANNLVRFNIRKSSYLADYPSSWGPDNATAMDRWAFLPGTDAPDKGRPSGYKLPQGYGVISGYECMVFIPLEMISEANADTWRRSSLEKPVLLGALHVTEKILEPELEPGTYFVMYRTKGKPPRKRADDTEDDKDPGNPGAAQRGAEPAQDEDAEPEATDFPFELNKNNVFFVDAETSEIASWIEVDGKPSYDKIKGADRAGWKVEKVKERGKGPDGKPAILEYDALVMTCEIPISTRGKCYPFELRLKPSVGVTARQWRGLKPADEK